MSRKRYYSITQLRKDVYQALQLSGDYSPTTIRTCANNMLDVLERDGYRVHHDYDQELLVKQVRRMASSMNQL